jgi:predicted Rossmann fold flavoprotein
VCGCPAPYTQGMPSFDYDVIVIGAGAAGLMCAIEAGRRGRRVVVLERNGEPGRKILISGGGRCNFTNVYAAPEHFYSDNPDFCRSALARYTPADFIELVEAHGIAYHEKKLGQMFCDGNARQIVELLLAECAEAGVEVKTGCEAGDIAWPGAFVLDTNRGRFSGESLVIASGGLSIPRIGATSFGYDVARQFGHGIIDTRPGLVPLTFTGKEGYLFELLSGVSLDATVSCNGASFSEAMLFTHRGLSGPAVLQASSVWHPGDTISIDLLPRLDASQFLREARDGGRLLVSVLSEHVPHRFAQAWFNAYTPYKPLERYTEREMEEVSSLLEAWQVQPAGSEGFAKAEVTVGGVDTRELDSRTMMSRKTPGLYFIGEVVDVTGWLGGYNFQWAWASGYAAGQAV